MFDNQQKIQFILTDYFYDNVSLYNALSELAEKEKKKKS